MVSLENKELNIFHFPCMHHCIYLSLCHMVSNEVECNWIHLCLFVPSIYGCFHDLCCYYIFLHSEKNYQKPKNGRRSSKTVCRKNTKHFPQVQRKSRFTILVPTIIILTFILFIVIPNFMHMIHKNTSKLPNYIIDINWILVPLGFIADAVVYIFSVNAIRSLFNKYIRKKSITISSTSYIVSKV